MPNVMLQVGLNLAVPIIDLEIDNAGWRGTLSFNRRGFFCDISWGAVFYIVGVSGVGCAWPEDVPPELMPAVNDEIRRAAESAKHSPSRAGLSPATGVKKRPLPRGWSVIDGGKSDKD